MLYILDCKRQAEMAEVLKDNALGGGLAALFLLWSFPGEDPQDDDDSL